jgi:N-acyl-D-aspartate/D-glutamate deacylase
MLANLERRAGASNIMISVFEPDRSFERRRLDAIAREKLREPVDVAIDIILAGGATIISFNMQEEDIRRLMAQRWTMTSSDGSSSCPRHERAPRAYGLFPEAAPVRARGKLMPLEDAIRSMTGLTATVFRPRDRGFIRPGAFADITIFDPATITDQRPTRNHRYSIGIGMSRERKARADQRRTTSTRRLRVEPAQSD